MVDLKEQETELRLFLQSVEEQIEKFNRLKEMFAEKRDSIREAMQQHNFSLVPVKISTEQCEDVLAEIEQHLLELNKLKNYLGVKLKQIIEEEQLLESLKKKFGDTLEIDEAEHGFEIKYFDSEAKNAFEELQKSKEKISHIKSTLRKIEEREAEEQAE